MSLTSECTLTMSNQGRITLIGGSCFRPSWVKVVCGRHWEVCWCFCQKCLPNCRLIVVLHLVETYSVNDYNSEYQVRKVCVRCVIYVPTTTNIQALFSTTQEGEWSVRLLSSLFQGPAWQELRQQLPFERFASLEIPWKLPQSVINHTRVQQGPCNQKMTSQFAFPSV